MQVGRIEGHTRIVGKSQGFMGLPLRDEAAVCDVYGVVAIMTTAWLPTPKELAALNAGASVHVKIQGEQHPPILVEVGPVPE